MMAGIPGGEERTSSYTADGNECQGDIMVRGVANGLKYFTD